ncbi:glycosyltransferase family 4 protein [Trichloromonas sp.]|uniref:glycosyltransferase family 4 protein n=1 Tax=Trichloromonas sp. TaxID=3069249 RepID=UPI002A4610F4|nr:glycosyltransferase family 4 protein [Trichloromonas sp.]
MVSSTAHPRIALLLSELRPGGMERVVVHLAKGLAARNIPVLVICLQGEGLLASEFGGTAVRLTALNSYSGKDLGAVWRLRRELNRFKPSVIHLHDYASLPYALAANALAGRRPILFSAHGLLYEGFESLKSRYRFLSRFITAFSAVSDKVAARHRDYLAWPRPIQIIANGVPAVPRDADDRERVRSELGCEPGDFLFLAVGNPRPEKAFEDLIDAVALLPAGRKIRVVVAGTLNESDYCRMLKQRVEERQVGERFRFLGFRQDTAALYAAADAFVLSSRSEGLPMVILEAMMAGLPVVATRVGGIPDAVGEQALLVDAAQPAQLAAAMTRLITEPSLAETLGVAGKAYAEKNFGVERMVDAYIEWYRRVLRGEV